MWYFSFLKNYFENFTGECTTVSSKTKYTFSCNKKQQQSTPNRRRPLRQRNPPPRTTRDGRGKEQTGSTVGRKERPAERAQERNLKVEGNKLIGASIILGLIVVSLLQMFQEQSSHQLEKLNEENTALRNRLRDVAYSPLSDNEKQELLQRHHNSAPASIATNVSNFRVYV